MSEEPVEKRGAAIGARIKTSLRNRIDEIHKRQGTNDAALLEDLLKAACDYAAVRGFYERPIRVIFDEDAASHQRFLVAEKGPDIPLEVIEAALQKKASKDGAAKRPGSDGAGKRS